MVYGMKVKMHLHNEEFVVSTPPGKLLLLSPAIFSWAQRTQERDAKHKENVRKMLNRKYGVTNGVG